MGIEQDIAAFELRLNLAVQDTMEHEVYEAARSAILASVYDNVYAKYTPSGKDPYIRRYNSGGLGDPRNIVIVDSGTDGDGYQIKVSDIAPDEDGVPIAGVDEQFIASGFAPGNVIESGVGYTWTRSLIYKMQPFPRHFYGPAEDTLKGGLFHSALMRGLQNRGFITSP